MKILLPFFILFPLLTFSQTVQGTIFNEDVPLEYVLVTNSTLDRETFSNEEGSFTIEANENDELIFSTPFFLDKKYVVNKESLQGEIKVHMQLDVNKLEEVVISNYTFKEGKYNADFRQQILNDIKNNPHLYERPSNGTIDFVKIFKRVNKLFKKKDKPIPPSYISYPELKKLLLEREFNGETLIEILQIKERHFFLFVDFCRDKMEEDLVKEQNSFLLLDQFIKLSEEFKELNKK